MPNFLRYLLKKVPGVSAIDKKLRVHYAGYDFREPFPRGHFYSPLPDIHEIQRRKNSLFGQDIKEIPGIDLRSEQQLELLTKFTKFYDDFKWPRTQSEKWRFHFDQVNFAEADAFVLFSMLREFKPKRVIEVGSGFSSALMLDTNEYFLNNSIELVFIEPFPALVESLIRPQDRAHVVVKPNGVQAIPVTEFADLAENDILFIDSTHVSRVGSDVNHLFFEILPALKPGVIIHVHDIFWPFEYPESWLMQGRAWNEAYLLRAFLQFNKDFEIIMFNTMCGVQFRSFIEVNCPLFLKDTGSSIWLRKV